MTGSPQRRGLTPLVEPGLKHYLNALSCLEGHGIEYNIHNVFEWLQNAMKAGEIRAMTKLAWLHERGQGVRINKRKALELYTEAALRGEPEAQFRLAIYHLRGDEEVENPSPQLARELLEKSVAGGCPEGMREIGQMYERGGLYTQNNTFVECCEPDINKA